ncbi:phosphohistidine phosphatase SixA [Kistimonas scapharcae]|uniref:Phosphohistidine phosphatase SixA n=1 Tax=Kistimonas scapharcae TaxID=1036133 RepID=A0ABP8V2Q1_9GAMM
MKLYIMRHGEAAPFADVDRNRSLSEHGRWQVSEVARQMSGLPLNGILASPYLRAQQTAELMQVGMTAMGIPVVCCDQLIPDASVRAVLGAIPDSGCWLLVSHMPLVSSLAGLLMQDAPDQGVIFSTAMVVGLEMPVVAPGLATQSLIYLP